MDAAGCADALNYGKLIRGCADALNYGKLNYALKQLHAVFSTHEFWQTYPKCDCMLCFLHMDFGKRAVLITIVGQGSERLGGLMACAIATQLHFPFAPKSNVPTYLKCDFDLPTLVGASPHIRTLVVTSKGKALTMQPCLPQAWIT